MIGNINISGIGFGVTSILSDPPASPTQGADYGIGPNATGAWAGHSGKVARADANQVTGWLIFDSAALIYDADTRLLHDLPAGDWEPVPNSGTSVEGPPGPEGPQGPTGPAGPPGPSVGGGGGTTLADVDLSQTPMAEIVVNVQGFKRLIVDGLRVSCSAPGNINLRYSLDGTTFPNGLHWTNNIGGGRSEVDDMNLAAATNLGVQTFQYHITGLNRSGVATGHYAYHTGSGSRLHSLRSDAEIKAIRFKPSAGGNLTTGQITVTGFTA